MTVQSGGAGANEKSSGRYKLYMGGGADQYRQSRWVMTPTQASPFPPGAFYVIRIFHTKLVDREARWSSEELDNDQWKQLRSFRTWGMGPYLFNGGLPLGGSDGFQLTRHHSSSGSSRNPLT